MQRNYLSVLLHEGNWERFWKAEAKELCKTKTYFKAEAKELCETKTYFNALFNEFTHTFQKRKNGIWQLPIMFFVRWL